MTSTFSPNLNLEEPATGDYVNAWASPVNSNFTVIDGAFGGSATVTSTGGTVNLTAAQSAVQRITVTGVLISNLVIQTSNTFGGRIYFLNSCTLGGFTVTVKNGGSDPRGNVILPYGLFCPVVFTGSAAFYDNYQALPPGTKLDYFGSSAPPGFLLCNGASLTTAAFPELFGAIGYVYGGAGANFNVPDTRGRVTAGADNMGGSAAGRLTGYTLATTGGEQTHILTTAELAAHNHGVTDPTHVHGTTDPGHFHTIAMGGVAGSGFAAVSNNSASSPSTSTSTTGISINAASTGITIQNNGSGTAHNNIQPTMAVNHIIRF